MPITAAGLRADIIAEFQPPPPIQWTWLPSQTNYMWLDELCNGFFDMWTAGILTPGVCTLPGPSAHTHTVATLVFATMATPAKTLGFSALADLFIDRISEQVALFLVANAAFTVATPDACIPHDHTFLSFGVPATLATNIAAQATIIGAVGPGILPWATSFATGLLSHLTANAEVNEVTHPVLHILS